MSPFNCYLLFLSLKRHFTTEEYDAFKYHFKVRGSQESFEKRNDRYFFSKLCKHENPKGFLLAAFVKSDKQNLFIGNIVRDSLYRKYYTEWKKYQEGIEYFFQSEINTLQSADFVVKSGQYPRVIEEYLAGRISIETLCILNREVKIFNYWSKNVSDHYLFPDIAFKVKKYQGFLEYNRKKIRSALSVIVGENSNV